MKQPMVTKDLEDYVVSMRRYFHQQPEISLQEEKTRQRICTELELMGIPYELIPPFSVVAWIGENTGLERGIAIRADIDALPMKEESDLPFRSLTDTAAHTCGHDAHTAVLLGTARYFADHKELLKGRIYFCFQCAEELGKGATEVVDYLKSKGGVDRAIGLHVVPELCSGQISIEPGPRMAGAGSIHVKVKGQGGHGSRPDRCIDPIRPACEMILKMSAFPSNLHNALEPTVVNIGRMKGGTADNIVPDSAEFGGTFRYFTPGLYTKIIEVLTGLVQGTASSYGAEADIEIDVGTAGPVINQKEASALAEAVVASIEGLTATEVEPDMGSDNYSEFLDAFGGMYAFLGIAYDLESAFPHHHSKFHIDESALKYGVEFFVRYVHQYQQQLQEGR